MLTQAPAAICAQSVLAAATLAVQAHRDVELPGGGRRPLTGLFASVAESGERKTSVDRLALAPAYRVEEQWRGEREGQVSAFVNDLDAWKAARESRKEKEQGGPGRNPGRPERYWPGTQGAAPSHVAGGGFLALKPWCCTFGPLAHGLAFLRPRVACW